MGVHQSTVDFSPLLEELRQRPQEIAKALAGSSLAICCGNRALLGAWLHISHGEPGLEVVGAVTTAAEALELIEEHHPDVLVCTDRLEQGDGVSLVEAIKQRQSSSRTLLVVSDTRSVQPLQRALAAGCDGICMESRVGQGTLVAAMQAMAADGQFVDRELMGRLRQAGSAAGPSPVTKRELEVLDLIQLGLSNQEIGRRLYLSEQTVKSHVASLLQKLGARDRAQAVVLGLRRGLIDWRDA